MRIKGPIVVVDDDDDDHYIIKRVLEKMGVNTPVCFFNDSKDALQFLQETKERPFIILCDVNMPLLNGLELKRRINDDERMASMRIPFVFFSTGAMASIIKEAFDLGVQGFFIKAQSLDEVEKTLSTIIHYWAKSEGV